MGFGQLCGGSIVPLNEDSICKEVVTEDIIVFAKRLDDLMDRFPGVILAQGKEDSGLQRSGRPFRFRVPGNIDLSILRLALDSDRVWIALNTDLRLRSDVICIEDKRHYGRSE